MTLEGWGVDSGSDFGFGQSVFRVTNTNGSGSGSFLKAMSDADTASGGLIVFETSGVIDLVDESYIYWNHPNITIAGQTAPPPGITFIKNCFHLFTHDFLIQHVRVRAGSEDPIILAANPDGSISRVMAITANWQNEDIYNVVIDHCSLAWGVDGTFQIGKQEAGRRMDGISFTNNIVGEALVGYVPTRTPQYLHGDGEHGYGGTVHVETATLAKNLFAHGAARMPQLNTGCHVEYINNLSYNSRYYNMYLTQKTSNWPDHQRAFDVVAIGNYGKQGPGTVNQKPQVFINSTCQDPGQKIYYNDNKGNQTNWIEYRIDAPATASVLGAPGDSAAYTNSVSIWDADDVITNIMAGCGAWPVDRDSVDERIIGNVQFTSGPDHFRNIDSGDLIINTEADVGGYPTLAVNVRPLGSIPASANDQRTWLEPYTIAAETGGDVPPPHPGHWVNDIVKVGIT